MSSIQDSNLQADIQSSLNAIIDIAQRWSIYLRRRQSRVRVAKALLTGTLVFLTSAAIMVASILTQYSPEYFNQNRSFLLTILASVALVGVISGGASYHLLGRRQDPRLEELSDLVQRMNNNNENRNTAESALSLAEKILGLLPELVRKKDQDALLFGIVAFNLTIILARSPGIAVVVGIAVWLYFRYESNTIYDREITKLEERRKIFEQQKKDFVETL